MGRLVGLRRYSGSMPGYGTITSRLGATAGPVHFLDASRGRGRVCRLTESQVCLPYCVVLCRAVLCCVVLCFALCRRAYPANRLAISPGRAVTVQGEIALSVVTAAQAHITPTPLSSLCPSVSHRGHDMARGFQSQRSRWRERRICCTGMRRRQTAAQLRAACLRIPGRSERSGAPLNGLRCHTAGAAYSQPPVPVLGTP